MKRVEQDRLLREILADEDLSALRQTSLERGLVSLRRQRRMRNVWRAGGLVSLVLLPLLAVFLGVTAHSRAQRRASVKVASAAAPQPRVASPRIRVITDDELFALFPGRALALTGKPGHQELIFLDQPAPTEQQ